MSGTRWAKFFWADWQSDPKLRLCSANARGVWMECLCIAAQADPIGYVVIDGRALSAEEISQIASLTVEEVSSGLKELGERGVFSVDRRHRIYNRRMIRAAKLHKIFVESGKKGGDASLGKSKTKSPTLKGNQLPRGKPYSISQKLEEDSSLPSQSSETGESVFSSNGKKHDHPVSEISTVDEVTLAFRAYNSTAERAGLKPALKLTAAREANLKARIADAGGLDGFRAALDRVAASTYLTGGGREGWRADFDFVLRPDKFLALQEGRYDDSKRSHRGGELAAAIDRVGQAMVEKARQRGSRH